jgi:hypothetical protein
MPRTELRTEVEIQAPPAVVYGVLTDFQRYPEWNPFLTAITGKLEPGARLSLELSLPEGAAYSLSPTLERATMNEELRWRSFYLMKALLEAEHFFFLREREPGVTRVVHGQNFSGFLLRFAGSSLTLAARGAVYMNLALKKRAESTR